MIPVFNTMLYPAGIVHCCNDYLSLMYSCNKELWQLDSTAATNIYDSWMKLYWTQQS